MSFKVVNASPWKFKTQSPILSIEKPAKDGYMHSIPSITHCLFYIPPGFDKIITDFTIE